MTEQHRQDHSHLDTLLATIDQAVIFVSEQQRITRCTAGSLSWLRAAGLAGQALSELFPANMGQQLATAMDRARTESCAQALSLEMRPERLPAWRAHGLSGPRQVELRVAATNDGWLLLIGEAAAATAASRGASQTQRDSLTGAYNRRAFMPVLIQSLAQAQRYDWPCCVMMIDVDDLSRVNDRYGLDTGDRLLQLFVSEMLAKKRGSDFFARYDGDSFVVFMPETNLEQGMQAAARVHRLAADLRIETPDGGQGFTLSIGVSTLAGMEDSAEALLARVGENVFIARQSGGNRSEGDQ